MKKKHSRLTKELLELGEDLKKIGIIDEDEHKKITMRLLKKKDIPIIEPLTSAEIRAIREREHLSQAVFAKHLNLTPGYISKLERGLKEPTGAVLTLLNVVRRKGIGVIL